MTMLSLETRVLPTASPVRCAVVVHGDAVLTGHDDGMVRGWASDGSSSWKETDRAKWKVQVRWKEGRQVVAT